MNPSTRQSPAEKLVLYVGAGTVLLMILHISVDILTRNFFRSPIEGTYEITVHWYMVAITAIGLWAAAMKNDHIVVTLVSDRLAVMAQLVWRVTANIVTIAVLLVLSWYGFDIAMDRMASGEFTGAAEIPIWQTRFFLPTGLLAFAVVMAVGTVRDIAATRASQEVLQGGDHDHA